MARSRHLPPLNWLRVFEAAARNGTFTRAADELGVTGSAVSQQIRQLEEWFQSPLFDRSDRAVTLTQVGERLYPVMRIALDQIDDTIAEMIGEADRRLVVTATPSFTAKWLVPRLGRFTAAHPDIEVRLVPGERLVDFDREDVDVGIRFGRGGYEPFRDTFLLPESVFPVCAPDIAARLRRPADLAQETLIHDELDIAWPEWLQAAGVEDLVDTGRGPRYGDPILTLEAALAGQGVALARMVLVREALESGRLARPFTLCLDSAFAYYVVASDELWRKPKVKAFREWLAEEVKLDEARGLNNCREVGR